MNEASRTVLAQAATIARFGGHCEGRHQTWTKLETAVLRTDRLTDALVIAEPLAEICADCPVRQDCSEWATVDRYTGFAAGTLWSKGKPRSRNGSDRASPRH